MSKLLSGLQDEVGLLDILGDTVANLRPFLASQSQIFPEASLDRLLEGSEVKTDEQRMATSSGMGNAATPEGEGLVSVDASFTHSLAFIVPFR